MATPTLLKLTKRERAAIDSYLEDQAAAPLPPPPPSRASNRPAPQPNGDATRAALTKTKKDALRAALPAFQHRAAILDTIDAHAVTILRGATGCGKSTQVPKMLTELFPRSKVLCTQPRRLAVVAVARRAHRRKTHQGFRCRRSRERREAQNTVVPVRSWADCSCKAGGG